MSASLNVILIMVECLLRESGFTSRALLEPKALKSLSKTRGEYSYGAAASQIWQLSAHSFSGCGFVAIA